MTPATRAGNFTYLAADGQSRTVNLLTLGGVAADPRMQAFIDQTPLPNDTSTGVGDGVNIQGHRFNNTDANDGKWFVLRMDYELNQQHRLSGTFHQFKFAQPVQGSDSIGPVFLNTPGAGQKSTRRLGAYTWQSSFLPTLNNELRFGFQWAPVEFFNAETFPDGYILTWPDIVDNPVQDFLGQGRNSPIWEIHDNATWVKGNHTFMLGGGFRNVTVDQFNDAGIIPDYTIGFGVGNPSPLGPGMFPGGISGNDFANAGDLLAVLGGFVDEGEQTFNVTSRTSGFVDGATQNRILKQKFFNLYAGDIWRVTPNLTLNFQLRWEYHSVPTEENGLALLPKGGVAGVLDPNAVIDFAGEGTGRNFFNSDRNNFSPGFGLAYRIRPNLVFRGGYSINYVVDNNMTVVLNALRGNDGLTQTELRTALAGTVSGGGLTPIPTPEFKVPRTARDQIDSDPTAALYTIDENLKTPYVQQWNVGLQFEPFRDTAFEVRYVGNRGSQLTRAIDLNQVKFPQNFVDDFRRAQNNLIENGNPFIE